METIVIIDTETTGLDTDTCELVEVAALKLRGTFPGPLEVVDAYWSPVHPVGPVPPECSAVHHLTDADLDGAPDPATAMAGLSALTRDADVICGHNVLKYDLPILERGGVIITAKVLDTLRLAHHAWPELEQVGEATPSYGLEALRFRFGLGMQETEALRHGDVRWSPHSAAFDVSACRSLLDHAVTVLRGSGMKATTYADLATGSLKPYRVHIMPFGKHRGERLEDVPQDYIRWALGNMQDLDEDLRSSLRRVLRA